MAKEEQIKIQRIESLEDLRLLERGDVIKVKFVPESIWYGIRLRPGDAPSELAMIVRNSATLEVVMPHPSNKSLLRKYYSSKDVLGYGDGSVLFRGIATIIKNLDESQEGYNYFRNGLTIRGFEI